MPASQLSVRRDAKDAKEHKEEDASDLQHLHQHQAPSQVKKRRSTTSTSDNDTSADEAESDDDEDASRKQHEDRDQDKDPIDLATFSQRMSSRHRRSVVSSPVTMDTSWTPPIYPKGAADAASIRRSVQRNLLFSDLGEEQLQILVNAMQLVSVPANTTIIRQHDPGDLFYILESGTCQVVLDGEIFGDLEASSDRNFFGELALLYDAPRAATIRAVTDVECWSLDRLTFKRVLMATTMQQRKLYQAFMDQVPIFATLSKYEKVIVADALRVQYFDEGTIILQQGTEGDDFFLVEDGEVKCTQSDGHREVEVSQRLGSGDFFGELALLHDEARQATVTAVRRTKCLVLDRRTFKRLLGPMQEHLKKRADLYEKYMQQLRK